MKIQKYLWYDNTSANHFQNWSRAIHDALTTFGFLQQTDTGQVEWGKITALITKAASNGSGGVVYTYSNLAGGSFAVNQQVVIMDMVTAGFNIPFGGTITAVTVTNSTTGTFTVTNATTGTEIANTGRNATATAFVGSTCTITNASAGGTTSTYTYTGLVGTLRNGQLITVNGCTTSGFNQTGTLSGLNTGAGTFQIVGNNNGSTSEVESGAVATVTSVGGVPAFSSTLTPVVLALTSVANSSGGTAVYTGTITGGGSNAFADAIFTVAGFTGANNGTFLCVASTGSNLTLVNASATAQTPGGSPTATSQTVPYEIWASNDGLTTWYLKFEYGTIVQATSGPFLVPGIASTISATHNGSGSVTATESFGFREVVGYNSTAALPSQAFQFECDFFSDGTAGMLGIFMWKDCDRWSGSGTYDAGLFIGIERDRDNTGAATGTFLTHVKAGGQTNTWALYTMDLTGSVQGAFFGPREIYIGIGRNNNISSFQGNGNGVVATPVFPEIGFFGNPLTVLVTFSIGDVQEGQFVTADINGTPHTYIVSKSQWTNYINSNGGMLGAFGMRWE